MRRFEYIQANQAKFWEVSRRGATLTVKSGRIGGPPKMREKQLQDFMAAEQEFDRLIRDKLRRGYVEVHAATETNDPIPDRVVLLRPLDGSAPLELRDHATKYIAWRMIEVGVMDKQAKAPDLERWSHRAARRLRLEEVPAPGTEPYEEFRGIFLELSQADRGAETGQYGVVGAYKLLSGTEWIVTPKEAAWLGDATRNRTPRRHKMSASQERWLGEWQAFHDRLGGRAGYVVELVSERRPADRRAHAEADDEVDGDELDGDEADEGLDGDEVEHEDEIEDGVGDGGEEE